MKIFEHRRNFPDEPIMAYMYVSSPVKAITGVVYLGKRHCLSDWMEDYKEDGNAVTRIKEYIEKYYYRYAMEIDRFQETSQISLDDLRKNVPGFVQEKYISEVESGKYIELDCPHYVHDYEYGRISEEIKSFLRIRLTTVL